MYVRIEYTRTWRLHANYSYNFHTNTNTSVNAHGEAIKYNFCFHTEVYLQQIVFRDKTYSFNSAAINQPLKQK